jgi:cytochrome P450
MCQGDSDRLASSHDEEERAVDEPGTADIAAAFAHYEPYGIVPDGWMAQLRRVRGSCPVVHSDACGGFWLVSRHDDVATILRTPAVFSSAGWARRQMRSRPSWSA